MAKVVMKFGMGLFVALALIAGLFFIVMPEQVLADEQPDGSVIDLVQDLDGTWGPGVITATADVVIDAGVVITIAPNTTIRVADGAGFTVNGDLHTEGPVLFTSISATPGSWDGVTYAPNSSGSLTGVTVEYAQHGLTLNTANAIAVSDSTFRYNQHAPASGQLAFGAGITLQQGDHVIERSLVHGNTAQASGSGQVRGAGIYVVAGAPQIRDSWVYENTASGSRAGAGGGISVLAGAPLIEGCTIVTNTLTGNGNNQLKSGGGIGFVGDSSTTIRGSWIAANRTELTDGYAGGGGIGFGESAEASLIEECVIYDNYIQGPGWCEGAGIDTWDTENAVIVRNNLIISNTSGTCLSAYGAYGGGINLNGGGTGVHVINNTIVGNQAGRGGGVFMQGGTLTVMNNVIVNNVTTKSTTGGGIHREAGTADYNDVWGNTDPQTRGTMGSHTLYVNPSFLGSGELAAQYHLGRWSPLVDAGTNSATGLPDDDYDGDVRPLGAGWDMGFDEVMPVLAISKAVDLSTVEAGGTLHYTVVVENSGEGVATGLTLSDPLPSHTSYAAGSSQVTVLTAPAIYRDELTNVAYNGSNGTIDWSGSPWVEIGENNGPNSGDVRVVTDQGDRSLRLARNGRGISRAADLSGFVSARLSFEYRRNGFDNAADYVALEVSTDSGGSWMELDRFTGPATDGGYQPASYDLSGYLDSDTVIRFLASGMASNDYFYVDNVQIRGWNGQETTSAAGDPPALLSDATLGAGERLTVTFAVTVDQPLVVDTLIENTASVTSTEVLVPLSGGATSTVVNTPPDAVDDEASTDEDTVATGAVPGVLDNDTDANSDTLTVTTFDATSSYGASVVVNADGSYSYDPTSSATLQALAVGEQLTDTFTYTIFDGNGGSDTATVSISVSGVNDAPLSADDSGATDEDTVLTVPAAGLLGNDSDVDSDGATLTVTAFDATSSYGASVVVNADGSYSYDPTGSATLQALAAGATLADTFSYTIADIHSATDTSVVTVTVTGRNDAPMVEDQNFSVDENSADGTTVGTVSADDVDSGDALTFAIVAGNTEGAFAIDSNTGEITVNDGSKLDYETTSQYVLTVEVTDAASASDSAAITIDVNDMTYAPILEMVKDGPAVVDVDEEVTYTLTISHAVTSDGSPVWDLDVSDSLAGEAFYVGGDTDGDLMLDAGETWVYTATYTVQSDDPSPLLNTATLAGKDLDGNPVNAEATHSATIQVYTLDVVLVGNGTVLKDPDQATYRYGEMVTLTATAAPGWSFDAWSGDATGSLSSVQVSIDGNKAVTATFANVPANIVLTVEVAPTFVHAPGEPVIFTVHVANTSGLDTVKLTGLSDDVHGDLHGEGSCVLPQTLTSGSVYDCSFTADVPGTAGDAKSFTFTASGTDADTQPISDDAEVIISVVPRIPQIGDYMLFLPLVQRNYTLPEPNLIVEQILAASDTLQIVVKNTGTAAVNDAFWVDLYVNPNPVPTAVNQLWDDGRCAQGAVWGVEGSALPLDPGESLTLTIGDGYYWDALSRLNGPIPVGSALYAQVDSASAETSYGAIFEDHERAGGFYDNISNLTLTTQVTLSERAAGSVGFRTWDPSSPLPSRE